MRSSVRPKALVAAWFDFLTDAQRGLASELQAAVRRGLGSAQEDVRWGNLVFTVNDQAVLALVPLRTHMNLQVYGQLAWPPTLPVLEQGGRSGRYLRFRLGQPVEPLVVERVARYCAEQALLLPARTPARGESGEVDFVGPD